MGAERPGCLMRAACANDRADRSMRTPAPGNGLARFFAEAQMREIMDAAALVLSRGLIGASAPVAARASARRHPRAGGTNGPSSSI